LSLTETTIKKELTRERFAAFLVWLSPDAERAGEAYERLRFRLIMFFSHRHCRFAEELADETINRVTVKIGVETIENKLAYTYAVARNVFLESLRAEKIHVSLDEINVAAKAPPAVEPDLDNECLEKCLNELAAENRALILDYFSEAKQAKIDLHKKISARLEMTQTALRMKIVRLKQKIRICMRECMT
jgi:DNA-directed RNA polymerase specialized sigma24 family protein